MAERLDGSMTVDEAMEFTGLGRSYLYQLMDGGSLQWAKVGKRRLILRSSLLSLLRESLQPPRLAVPAVPETVAPLRPGNPSLRDYFAAEAMQGILLAMVNADLGLFKSEGSELDTDRLSAACYEIADAMLAERQKQQ